MMEPTLVEGKPATEATLIYSGVTQPAPPTLLWSGVKKLNVEDETIVDAVIGHASYGMGGEAMNLRQITDEKL